MCFYYNWKKFIDYFGMGKKRNGMMIDFKQSSNISIERKKSRGYSVKIGNARLCNVEPNDSLYKVICRSKIYADAFSISYKTSAGYINSRDYHFYIATLSKEQLEKWTNDIVEIGIDKRLDNR